MTMLNNELYTGTKIKDGSFAFSDCLPYMLEVAVGTLLGDSSLVTDAKLKRPTGFSLQFVSSHQQYIDHLYNVFSPWTRAKIYDKNIGRISTVTKEPLNPCWGFITRVQKDLLSFESWRKTNIIDGKIKMTKILPPNIGDLLNPRVISYWFMDDGSYVKGKKMFNISTDGFTKIEVEHLILLLNKNFNLDCYIWEVKNKKIFLNLKFQCELLHIPHL